MIDLWVGGLAEDAIAAPVAQLGKLFHTIIKRQFETLRDADRFWYERSLTVEEQHMINQASLASVIRNNTAIGEELQDRVFRVPTGAE